MDYPINILSIVEYATAYADAVCDKAFAGKTHIGGRELAQITPVKQLNAFLVKDVFDAWQQEASRLRSPYFDYEAPEVQERLNALMKVLSQHVRLDRQQLEPMLELAAIRTLRLAFRPSETIQQYLKQLDKRIPVDRLLLPQLKYLKMHPKFLQALQAKLADVDEIKRKSLLQEVEKLAASGHLFELPYRVMSQFSQTLPARIGQMVPTWADSEEDDELDQLLYAPPTTRGTEGAVPGFEDKEQHYEEEDYLYEGELALYAEEDTLSEEALIGEEERPISEADRLGLLREEELKDLAQAPAALPPTPEPAQPASDEAVIGNLFGRLQPEPKPEPEAPKVAQAHTPWSTPPPAEKPATPEPPQRQPEPPAPEPLPEPPAQQQAPATAEAEPQPSLLDKLRAAQAKEAEEEEAANSVYRNIAKAQSNYAKIKGTIPLNLKFRYLNELFQGDAAAFEQAIDLIDGSADYHTAVALVKEQYIRKYGWDFSNDTTREFLSMISRKFE
jgi:outer membrane biosynthesis protein TonB